MMEWTDEGTGGGSARDVVQVVRRALADAEARTPPPEIPPPLVEALVEKGLWSLEEGLACARRLASAEALARLAPRLPEPERRRARKEALGLARSLEHDYSRGEALAAVAPLLAEPERSEAMREALSAVHGPYRDWGAEQVITRLAPHLPESLVRDALAVVRDMRYESRVRALVAVAARAPGRLLSEVVSVACATEDDYRDGALHALAPYLTPELAASALPAAEAIARPDHRTKALAALVPRLLPAERERRLPDTLAAVRAIENEHIRAPALVALIPALPEPQLDEELAAARRMESDDLRAMVLATALEIRDSRTRVEALVRLVPYLTRGLLARALAGVRYTSSSDDLARLAPHLPEPLETRAWRAALAATWRRRYEDSRVGDLLRLAPDLPQELIPEALAMARRIRRGERREKALAALEARLLPVDSGEALAAVRRMEDEDERAERLAALAPRLPKPLLSEAVEVARAIQDPGVRGWALAALTGYLDDVLKRRAVCETMVAVESLADEEERADILVELAPHLPEPQRREALGGILALGRAEDLAALAPVLAQFPPAELHPLWQGVLQALAKRGTPCLLEGLAALAPVLAALGGPMGACEVAAMVVGDSAGAGKEPLAPRGGRTLRR
ncbi:MAG: hypothetical protein HY321_03640 [Armatimonadetes bacterium]|nr:hypothetical protein [Armatimonadota bacterium]